MDTNTDAQTGSKDDFAMEYPKKKKELWTLSDKFATRVEPPARSFEVRTDRNGVKHNAPLGGWPMQDEYRGENVKGLALRVYSSGVRSWVFHFTFNGVKQTPIVIGPAGRGGVPFAEA